MQIIAALYVTKNPSVRPERFGKDLVKDDPFCVRLVSDDRLLDIAEQVSVRISPCLLLTRLSIIVRRML
jgi:hypothetical protein